MLFCRTRIRRLWPLVRKVQLSLPKNWGSMACDVWTAGNCIAVQQTFSLKVPLGSGHNLKPACDDCTYACTYSNISCSRRRPPALAVLVWAYLRAHFLRLGIGRINKNISRQRLYLRWCRSIYQDDPEVNEPSSLIFQTFHDWVMKLS